MADNGTRAEGAEHTDVKIVQEHVGHWEGNRQDKLAKQET